MSGHHKLRPAHSLNEVTIPNDNNRNFFGAVCDRNGFQSSRSERAQVHFIFSIIQETGDEISYSQIGNFMNISKSTVQYHLSREDEMTKIRRPSLLNDNQHRDLLYLVIHS